MKSLFFDTETSGLALYKESYKHPDQPWIVQLAMILADESRIYHKLNILIYHEQREIEPKAQEIHGISVEDCELGLRELLAAKLIESIATEAEQIVCHNVSFDKKLVLALLHRNGFDLFCDWLDKIPSYCTMQKSTDYCKLPPKRFGNYKWPKLEELYKVLFDQDLQICHDALGDVEATMKCYYKLKELGI